MMDQIHDCCMGVIDIADDVFVHGKDDKEHDICVHKFMRVACEHGLVFNKDKCAVKQASIVFFIWVYDTTGVHPDLEKVSVATQLQKFLRLVTYLSPFTPSFSSFTTLLHELLKKGTEFIWNNSYEEAFEKVKSMFAKIPHCSTLMSASLSLSKLMHAKKA